MCIYKKIKVTKFLRVYKSLYANEKFCAGKLSIRVLAHKKYRTIEKVENSTEGVSFLFLAVALTMQAYSPRPSEITNLSRSVSIMRRVIHFRSPAIVSQMHWFPPLQFTRSSFFAFISLFNLFTRSLHSTI